MNPDAHHAVRIGHNFPEVRIIAIDQCNIVWSHGLEDFLFRFKGVVLGTEIFQMGRANIGNDPNVGLHFKN